jgi:hypothetical protein
VRFKALLSAYVISAKLVQQLFQTVYFFIRSGFNADQDAAATDSRFLNFRAIFRYAGANQRANQTTRRTTRAQTRERRGNWTSNHEIQTR